MEFLVVALLKNAPAGRKLLELLDESGLGGEILRAGEGVAGYLAARGVPPEEARAYADSAASGHALLCVHAEEELDAAAASELAEAQGGATRIYERRPREIGAGR